MKGGPTITEQKLEWMVTGECVEGCTSPPVCPAYWNSPLQAQLHNGQSHCEGVWTFNIRNGYYKDIDLSNLTVSYAFNSPSPFPEMKDAPWQGIIYICDRANAQQAEALERIYRICWETIGNVIMVKKASMVFQQEFVDGGPAARYSVRIEGIYNFMARPFRTVDKKPRYINSYWGGHVNIGVSKVNEFSDPDLPRGKWNKPGMSITYYDFVLNPDKRHWLP